MTKTRNERSDTRRQLGVMDQPVARSINRPGWSEGDYTNPAKIRPAKCVFRGLNALLWWAESKRVWFYCLGLDYVLSEVIGIKMGPDHEADARQVVEKAIKLHYRKNCPPLPRQGYRP